VSSSFFIFAYRTAPNPKDAVRIEGHGNFDASIVDAGRATTMDWQMQVNVEENIT
jgi:hypothetical protein